MGHGTATIVSPREEFGVIYMAVSGGATAQEHWSGRAAFILAAVGSAVGLGNLVRFPYVAGDNGGGAFVLIYLATIVLIGFPVLVAELIIGRRGGGSAIAAVSRLAKAEGRSGLWVIFPIVGIIACFLILSYYSVLAGWVLDFVFVSIADVVNHIGSNGLGAFSSPAFQGMSEDEISGQLGGLVSDPTKQIVMHGLFMAVTVFIVSRGIKGGIETAAKLLMPIFFALLLVLLIFSLVEGNAGQAFSFLFAPDFSQVSGGMMLAAVGQAFFSLSLGSSMMITYGLYMNREDHIPGASRVVAISDTMVALIAGLALFPIIFASPILTANILQAAETGNDPGLGLLFVTVPVALHQMPFGGIFGIAFFVMTLFAALTSAIALLEAAVAWWDGDIDLSVKERERRRLFGAIIIGFLAFLLGVGHALSQVPADQATFFNTWKPLDAVPLFAGMTLLDVVDTLTARVLLPFGGVATALFAGWALSRAAAKEETGFSSERVFLTWRVLVRWVAPIVVGIVLINGAIIAPLRDAKAAEAEAAAAETAPATPTDAE